MDGVPLLRSPSTPHPAFHPLTVVEVDPVAEHAVSIGFDVSSMPMFLDYRAGQYVTLRALINGESVRQSYSIWVPPSRAAREGVIRVAAAAVQGGRMSPWLASEVTIGEVMAVLPPRGDFVLDEVAGPRHHVGVVGGSGITPVLAIAAAALEQHDESTVDLILANRTRESTVLGSEVVDLQRATEGRLRVEHILSRERVHGVRYGRIDPLVIRAVLDDVGDIDAVDDWWLCGPEGLIADVEKWLQGSGTSAEHIHRERFTSTGPVDPRKNPPSGT
ncbi:FAD-binding oxidoreductase [Knoellia sp. Soil729]|uniref:FAD-binding oxidoreductase n=1 Tax=Knoellia sp. Soil729 TaxID=1736394 RepID=UPI00070045DD|nr:FAD-binding oxidoreductase [Knoellia sp. Soil729]KRE44163.1 phenylacetic acid degradation NADH oxidoreductase PaaE [Knoellia sp. Soil729]